MASPGTTLQQASATRVPELDGVRGLAMSLVLVWHYLVGQVQSEPGSPVAYAMRTLSFTWAGVDRFFVLSGFLIGGILMDNAGAPHFFRSFFVRRAARIIPLYLVVLMLFGCAVAVGADSFGPGFLWLFHDPLPFWTYATYTQNCAMALSGAFGPAPLPVSDPLALRLSSFDSARVLRGSSPISGWNLAAQTPVGSDLVVLLPPLVEDPAGILDA